MKALELAEKLFKFRQFKKSEAQNRGSEKEDENMLAKQIKECEMLLRQNEIKFNFETEPELIDAHIYEREALMVRYGHLIRQAKLCGLKSVEIR